MTLLQYGTRCTCRHKTGRCCSGCLKRCKQPKQVQWAVMLGMVNSGYSEEDAWFALLDYANLGGEALQRAYLRKRSSARANFHKEFCKAGQWVADNPVLDRLENVVQLTELAHAMREWPELFSKGKAASAERAVMRRLIEIGVKRSSLLLCVSMRQLSEDVDMRPATVNAAIKRLTGRDELLRVFSKGDITKPTTYLLKRPPMSTTVTRDIVPPVPAVLDVTVLGGQVHRLFGADGLSHGAMEVFLRLPQRERARAVQSAGGSPVRGGHRPADGLSVHVSAGQPLPLTAVGAPVTSLRSSGAVRVVPAAPVRAAPTTSELAREMCKAYSTVRVQLLKLKDWGMAVQDEHGAWWRLDLDFEEHADRLGVRDTAALKKQRHQRERVRNLAKLVEEGFVEMSDWDGMVLFTYIRTGEVIGSFDADEVHGHHAQRAAV